MLTGVRAPETTVPLYERIYAVVQQVPAGQVATYGQIAAIVGRGTARTVGYAMAALRREDVPWHRVINREGRISARADGAPDPRQRERLVEEGVLFDRRGRVDLDASGWDGPDPRWLDAHGFHPAPRPPARR